MRLGISDARNVTRPAQLRMLLEQQVEGLEAPQDVLRRIGAVDPDDELALAVHIGEVLVLDRDAVARDLLARRELLDRLDVDRDRVVAGERRSGPPTLIVPASRSTGRPSSSRAQNRKLRANRRVWNATTSQPSRPRSSGSRMSGGSTRHSSGLGHGM